MTYQNQGLVLIEDNEALTSTFMFAAKFNKNHDKVMKKATKLYSKYPDYFRLVAEAGYPAHFKMNIKGLIRLLTQFDFQGEQALESDSVFTEFSEAFTKAEIHLITKSHQAARSASDLRHRFEEVAQLDS